MPDEIDDLLDGLAPKPQPKRTRPTTSHLDVLTKFAQDNKLTVGSTTGGRHNRGSLHYSGNAIDIRGSGAFDDATVARLTQAAKERGLKLRDERRRPAGQKVWTAPHVHIEYAGSGDDYDSLLDSLTTAPVIDQPTPQPRGRFAGTAARTGRFRRPPELGRVEASGLGAPLSSDPADIAREIGGLVIDQSLGQRNQVRDQIRRGLVARNQSAGINQTPAQMEAEVGRTAETVGVKFEEQARMQAQRPEIDRIKAKLRGFAEPGARQQTAEGVFGISAEAGAQAGNLIQFLTGGRRGGDLTQQMRVAQQALAELEAEDPDKGWGAMARRVLPQAAGEFSKMYMLSRAGAGKATLPVLGALSGADEGKAIEGALTGALYQKGFEKIAPLSRPAKAAIGVVGPTAVSVAQGEDPAKALLSNLAFAPMAIAEKASTRRQLRPMPEATTREAAPPLRPSELAKRVALRGEVTNEANIEATPPQVRAAGAPRQVIEAEAPRVIGTRRNADIVQPQPDISGVPRKGAVSREAQTETQPVVEALKQSLPTEVAPNRTTVSDTQFLSDLSRSESFQKKGFRGLPVETQRLVVGRMLSAIHDPKVREKVVKFVPIDVVNNLIRAKSPSDVLLHDKDMLQRAPAVPDANHPIPLSIDAADALVRGMARLVTEGGGVDLNTRVTAPESRTAVSARETDPSLGEPNRLLAGRRTEEPLSSSVTPNQGNVALKAGNIHEESIHVRHARMQPRRARNTASGTRGQFKKEATKADAESRRQQVNPVQGEAKPEARSFRFASEKDARDWMAANGVERGKLSKLDTELYSLDFEATSEPKPPHGWYTFNDKWRYTTPLDPDNGFGLSGPYSRAYVKDTTGWSAREIARQEKQTAAAPPVQPETAAMATPKAEGGQKQPWETPRRDFNESDRAARTINVLRAMPKFEGIDVAIAGSSVGTGARGLSANPHDIDIVFRVPNDAYFDTTHPFWKQADALSKQEGVDVWVASKLDDGTFGEVSRLSSGNGAPAMRLSTVSPSAARIAEKAISVGSAERHKQFVVAALSEGHSVPPEVLRDYPDLASRQGGPTKPATPRPTAVTPPLEAAAKVVASPAPDLRRIATQWTGTGTGAGPEYAPLMSAARDILQGKKLSPDRFGHIKLSDESMVGKQTAADAKKLVEAVSSSPPAPKLFRGVAAKDIPKVGDTLPARLESWSTKADLALQFANQRGASRNPVMFVVEGVPALNVSALTKARDRVLKSAGEHLTASEFKIVSVERKGDALRQWTEVRLEPIVPNEAQPKVGMRFVHSRQLGPDRKPETQEVTKIGKGVVYYRSVKSDGTLGGSAYVEVAKFPSIVKSEVASRAETASIPPKAAPPIRPPPATKPPPVEAVKAPEPPKSEGTFAKNERMQADREALGLDELPRPVTQKDIDVLNAAKAANQKDATAPLRIADKVLDASHQLSSLETTQIILRAQEIKNQRKQIMREIDEASDPEVIKAKGLDADALKNEYDKLSSATDTSGTEQARAFRMRQRGLDDDFDFLSMRARAKKAKGRITTVEEDARYQKQSDRIAELETELVAAQNKAQTASLQKQIDRVKRQTKRGETKQVLDEEFAALRAQFSTAKIETRSGVQSSGLAALDPEGKLTVLIAKMARNRVKAGVVEAEKLVDEVYGAISEHVEGLTKRELRDAISGYGIEGKDRRSELTKQLAQIRAELQKLSKSEDVDAGTRPAGRQQGPRLSEGVGKTAGPQLGGRQGPTLREGIGPKAGPQLGPRQGPLKSEAGKLPAVGPPHRLFSRNSARQRQLEKQEAEILRRLEQRDFTKTEREPLPYTRETYAIQKRVDELKADFQRELYRAERGVRGRVHDTAVGAVNIPKTLLSMADLSAVLRQGGVGVYQHPVLSGRAGRDMLRSFSERGFANVENAIKNAKDSQGRSLYDLAVKSGVEFTGVNKGDPKLSHREEGFFGSDVIDTLSRGRFNPLKYTVKPIKDFSERTFVSFLDSQRMRIFAHQAQQLRGMNLPPAELNAALKSQARYINIITGRGSLGRKGNQAAPLLNLAMFSPRLVASRFQLLNKMANPASYAMTPKGARKLQMIDNVKFAAGVVSTLALAKAAGADVNLDPDDSDFLKIKIGDARYDTLSGLQQPLRFLYRMAKASVSDTDTYAGADKGDIAMDFARSKSAPSIGLGWDWLEGKNRLTGKKFEPVKDTLRTAIPLPLQDFREAIKQDGAVKGIVETLPTLLGVGVQTYPMSPEKPETHAEKLARKLIRSRMPDTARTEEEIEASRKATDLRARSRRGEDVSAELPALNLTERQTKAITEAKGVPRFQEDVKRLGVEDILKVWRVASPTERSLIKPLLADKADAVDRLDPSKQAAIKAQLRAIGIVPVEELPAEKQREIVSKRRLESREESRARREKQRGQPRQRPSLGYGYQ